jgi:hypothetical protein
VLVGKNPPFYPVVKVLAGLILIQIFLAPVGSAVGKKTKAPKQTAQTPTPSPEPPKLAGPEDTYRDTPYQPGELADYKVYYLGVYVGFGKLKVHPPLKYEGEWVRVFSGHAKTGAWYEAIYKADDMVQAYARLSDFAAQKFYLKQDESKLFGSVTKLEKWFTFNHIAGEVLEVETQKGKEPTRETIPLEPGSIDTLSIAFRLRHVHFVEGKEQKFLLYSSKKNWWLKITPLGSEVIKVPAGTFQCAKLGVESYIGQHLEQKGPITVWISEADKHRAIVKIDATIKIGWMTMTLEKFSPGAPLQKGA